MSALSPTLSPVATLREERRARVTLKDVAKVAGVHFTTVSLALRNHPSIPEVTRQTIRSAAERLGYAPNPVFSALTHFHLHGRIRAQPLRLGFLHNQPLPKEGGHPLLDLLGGATDHARALGFEVCPIDLGPEDLSDALTQRLAESGIRGLLLADLSPSGVLPALAWSNFAVVKVNSLHLEVGAPVVAPDPRQAVRLACQTLRSHGYQRIGLVVPTEDEICTDYRYSTGYLIEQTTTPAAPPLPPLLLPPGIERDAEIALLRRWIEVERLDAVIGSHPDLAERLTAGGWRIPEDFACASLNASAARPDVSGTCPNYARVGAKAVSLLTSRLRSEEFGPIPHPSRTYVRSHWQNGLTTPPRR